MADAMSTNTDASVRSRTSTRHQFSSETPLGDESKPRLGRRESEPHSLLVNTLYDVLTSNFPNDRTMWDLHHYFYLGNERIDLQFDVSFFRDFRLPYTLSSYNAKDYNHRLPTMAINILSKSTWQNDLGINMDRCRRLGIPLYVIFNAHLPNLADYRAPFLRAYRLTSDGNYKVSDLTQVSVSEEGKVNPDAVLKVSDIVPFNLGIRALKKRHEGDLPLYELILVDPETLEILPTRAEQEKKRADLEKKRADLGGQEKELKRLKT